MTTMVLNWWNQPIGPNHWRFLLVVGCIYTLGYFISHVINAPYPMSYAHLLVDYHFGLSKRSLIGAIVGLFTDKVPIWIVFAVAGCALFIAFALFLKLYQTTFGFSVATLPLTVFIFGSPFFFKHFIKSMGYFDVYGFMLAVVVLLVPANSLGIVLLAGAGSIVLLFIHHIQMLLFIPVIGAIVIIRFYLPRKTTTAQKLAGLAVAVALFATFIGLQFFGASKAAPEELRAYMAGRMGSGGDAAALDFSNLWFRTYADEVKELLERMRYDYKHAPTYVFLFAIHYPLGRYFYDCIMSIKSAEQRRIVVALIVMITLGYGVILATAVDYGRWSSCWMICMILMLHAVRKLEGAETAPLIAVESKWAFRLACIVTALPRIGIVAPFR